MKTILEQLAFVTRNLPEPVVFADAKGHIVAVDDMAREFHGDFSLKANRMYDWPQQFEVRRLDSTKLRAEEFPLNRAVFGEEIDSEPLAANMWCIARLR